MVLAAGLGNRMRPLTDTRPKPLVEVNGKALVDHVLDRLEAADIREAVVNVHHHADMLEAHLATRTAPPHLHISDERGELLETGGGIKKALHLFHGEPFIAINADTIWIEGVHPNLKRLAEGFDPETMDALLLVAGTASSIGYEGKGDFLMDAHGRLSWRGERLISPFVYAGACVLKPELFADAPEGPFSLTRIFNAAIERQRLYGLRLEGVWMHVGTPGAIPAAEEAIRRSSD
ncbi:nucleotidyltransferase family protein [Azorhizobium doebereinerae]|uniref:nucleotidyltransferase family protein n=1 Tax=Azorhizobium doebereinerae TaxID=281091 RepID=UPI000684CE3C|nr:nucleotidyltransferase family protein [Azorhizobium doebereinerae]